MRRKRLFVTLLCLLVGMRMLAAEQKALVLNFEDGKQWSVFFKREPVVTFSGNYLVVTGLMNNASVELISCKRSVISDIRFEKKSSDDITGIGSLSKDELRIVQEGDAIRFYGLTSAEKGIKVYDLRGNAYPVAVSYDDASVQVSLSGIPKGIYMIKINNKKTIKITKK